MGRVLTDNEKSLLTWIHDIRIACELGYPKHVIVDLVYESNKIRRDQILHQARENFKD